MDDDELDFYLNQVFGIEDINEDGGTLQQLRVGDPVADDFGQRVPGCYRVKPARVE